MTFFIFYIYFTGVKTHADRYIFMFLIRTWTFCLHVSIFLVNFDYWSVEFLEILHTRIFNDVTFFYIIYGIRKMKFYCTKFEIQTWVIYFSIDLLQMLFVLLVWLSLLVSGEFLVNIFLVWLQISPFSRPEVPLTRQMHYQLSQFECATRLLIYFKRHYTFCKSI